MEPRDGKTPATIVSVAHLEDEERALVLGVLLGGASAASIPSAVNGVICVSSAAWASPA